MSGRKPTIGVALSVCNGAAVVGDALASVAWQWRQPDAVVLVDDGSTDATVDQVERWADSLPLTVVRHATNRGLWAGRNAGIEALGTDLVAFLDADDVWLPDHLRSLASLAGPGVIASATALQWWPGEALQARAGRRHGDRRPARGGGRGASDTARRLVTENFVFSGSMVARADVQAVGGYRPFPASEDWDLWLRMVRQGCDVRVCPSPTVLYRRHPGSMSHALGCLPADIAVLQAFLQEEPDASVRRVARRTLSDRLARQRVERAMAEASHGRPARARRQALAGLLGRRRTALLGVGMVVAPVATTRRWEGSGLQRLRRIGR